MLWTRRGGEEGGKDLYPHLTVSDKDLLRYVVGRCRSGFWLEGSPRSVVKCFLHDVETTGPPVRQAPYRLKGLDAAYLEKRISDDLARGQLVEGGGDEEWASPGFVVRSPKVRLVVDYRKANSPTHDGLFLDSKR